MEKPTLILTPKKKPTLTLSPKPPVPKVNPYQFNPKGGYYKTPIASGTQQKVRGMKIV